MLRFVFGVLVASVIWGYFAGGREQLLTVWNKINPPEAVEPVTADQIAAMREKDFVGNFRVERECLKPATALKQLECDNKMSMARASYYAQWNQQNANRFLK